ASEAQGLLPRAPHRRRAARLGALSQDQLARDRDQHRLSAERMAGVSPAGRPERLRGAAGVRPRRRALAGARQVLAHARHVSLERPPAARSGRLAGARRDAREAYGLPFFWGLMSLARGLRTTANQSARGFLLS